MLDGVHAPINRRLDGDFGLSVNGNSQVRAVSFLDNRRHYRHCDAGAVVVGHNLDEVNAVEEILIHRPPRFVGAGYLKKFLLQDWFGNSGIEILEIST
jgi:hypothetical protein